MFYRRSIPLRFLIPALLVVVIGGLGVLAARKEADVEALRLPALEHTNARPARAVSRYRNLSLQPEAAKLSTRLGQRFIASDSDLAVLIGEVVTNETRVPMRVIRRQDKRGESVEIAVNGKALAWSPAHNYLTVGSVSDFERSLIQRIVYDSADAFILAQLRGASYQVVGKNVRADRGGADNYHGPLWTVVRVSHSGADSVAKPESPARLFYINSRTGLLDKIVSEVAGEEVVATLDGWVAETGETFPSIVRWSRGGRQLMEFRVITFVRPNAK